ncbi:hypothetical protein MTR67_046428 [Solanum verrucosum]|uniref:F-box associated beta-propeller type 1 domain-containing protein n=1 Tax=Solanum verrucosum TaxID=315347 RepID=A0AAF0ZX82_SOLVR|nr:hypothetical protein MTR67_046428 [Solanum verrucosum]
MHEGKLAIRAAKKKKKKKSIANTEKTNLFKQISISNGEEATKFSRCKQNKSNQISKVQMVEDEQKLDWPSNCNPEDSVLYCSCDGLVLLAIYNGLDRHLLLWNPSTGESIVLPHPKSRPKYCVCGMGYDATTDDYKIVAIDLHETCQEITVEILTLKSGSWKEIWKYPPGIHRVIGVKDCGMYSLAFVHGAFHWVGLSSHCCTIVSFNISNEVYGEIPLLEHMCNIYKARFIEYGVSVLGGMLCFCSTYFNPWGGMFKLWMMKEYGVKESWTELLTIRVKVVDDEQKLDWPSNCKPVNSLLYCSCDGLVLLAVVNGFDRHLLLLNPSTGESIVLPHPKSEPKYCVCGMGYDATIDDYKILAIDLHDGSIR